MKKPLKITLTLSITIIMLLGFVLPLNPAGNWYQQFLPDLNGATIRDIIFTDSLNGYAVTSLRTANDSSYILKTSNSGDTWNIKFTHNRAFVRVRFINANTGFTNAFTRIYKTTNAGENWSPINLPGIFGDDMFVLSEDTIWLAMSESLTGGVFRTTNGGASWQQQFSGGNQNPNKIYMYNATLGFMCNNSASPNIYKTTNSGVNWNVNLPGENFFNMQFIDTLVGWKSTTAGNFIDSSMKKTTNGGANWFKQQIPYGPSIIQFGVSGFTCINKDTVWAVGNSLFYPNSQVRGMILRTINGGNNWLFQIPDTSITTTIYYYMNSIGKNNIWAYGLSRGIHTTNGGDTAWLTPLEQISSEVPKQFLLYQNYPNPFNPKTNIRYSVKRETSNVKLVVYDIQGKFVTELVNQKQTTGTYEVDFTGTGLSSGIYFYKLTVTSGKEVFSETKRMILLK